MTMPLYSYRCPECGAERESFEHHADDRGCDTILCKCGSTMGPMVGLEAAKPMLYFEEGRERIIENLIRLDEHNNEIVPRIRSWKDYEEAKRLAGVTEAGTPRGQKGRWI